MVLLKLNFLQIILIAVLILTFYPSLIWAHSEVQVIEMTPDGFKPISLTIDINSTVIFENDDKNPRWPASNVHPTHDIYPDFDPKMEIEPGKDWTFKPKRAGIFKFHDHLYPHFRGTLIVEEESVSKIPEDNSPSPSLNLVERIKNSFSSLFKRISSFFMVKDPPAPATLNLSKMVPDKQFKALEDFAKEQGSQKAWEAVQESFKGQAGSSGNIHDLAHLSGKLIYEEKGFEGIAVCTAGFAFGCYHGFLDTAFLKSLDKLTLAHEACLKLGSGLTGPVASCIHGIGHGIASFYSTSDLKSSLSSCRKLVSGREYCFDGVFMEFVRSAPESFFKKEDPLYPCNDLEKNFGPIYSFSCGRNQPSVMMGKFKMGFDQVVSVCRNASSKLIKQGCIDSLGFSLAGSGDTEQIIQGCQKIAVPELVLSCAKAAAGELIFQEVPGWEEKSEAVCNAFPQGLNECKDHLEKLIKDYSRAKKLTFHEMKASEDPNTYIRNELKTCYDAQGRDGCYKSVADLFYSQLGLSKSLKLLKANEQSPEVFARCHEVTHYLSRNEYEKQKDIAKVYSQCDSTCHGGCYHGTLEAYLKESQVNPQTNLTTLFPKVCGKKEDYKKPIEFNECFHGMGHAAMFVTDMELKESLGLCDTILDQQLKERCYTGVFMENSSSSTSFDHQSKYINPEDPFYPCNSLEEKYLQICWQYQSSYFSIINDQNWSKVADMCLQIPVKYQDFCFRTIGTNQVGFTLSMPEMKKGCDQMPSSHFQSVCIAGVISSLAYRFVGEEQRMIDFCSMADSNTKESCYRQVGTALLDWDSNRDLAKQNCSKIPDPQGSLWCLGAI